MLLKKMRASCVVLLLGVVAACGEDPETAVDGASVEPHSDDGRCPADTPPFEFGPTGLSAINEELDLKVYLEDASHMPPAHEFNDWTIALTDLAGAPLPAAQVTWACAYMPLHGHGSNPMAIEALGDGKFELLQQNMAMYGEWLIRLWVDPSGQSEPFESSGTSIGTKACSEPGTTHTLEIKTCVPQ